MTTKELNARQARWADELCAYDFRIEHIKGKENKVADALSRRADYQKDEKDEEKTQMLIEEKGTLLMNKQMRSKIVRLNRTDESLLEEIRKETLKDEDRKELKIEKDGFKRFNGLTYIPKKKEQVIIERFHDDIREGHPGIARIMEKIQRCIER
jgi:hypothetical protein